jgi:hypothetical protein
MKDLSWFKKFRLFIDYWRLINKNKEDLINKSNGLNLRIDRVGRIYTVFNCPDDVSDYGSGFPGINMKSSTELAEKYIKDYIGRAEAKFINLGMIEYIGIRDMERIGELDYLIIFGFKGFDTAKFFGQTILYSVLIISSIIGYFLIF